MTDRLAGYRCTQCAHTGYPRHLRCPQCRGTRFEEVELRGGHVINYTVVHAPPKGVAPPLVLGLVELDHGVRILGRLLPAALAPGTPVRPVWITLREKNGAPLSGYAFEATPAGGRANNSLPAAQR